MESILDSIKLLLSIQEDDFTFDGEIIMFINSVFMNLSQLGVSSDENFKITSSDETWNSFFGTREDLESVKTYVYLKVRMLFDPPQNSFLVDSIQKQIAEFEWRLNVQTEPYTLTVEY
jgi:hypothetical protein